MKSDLGVTMLAHSITLTPGTLSVDVDEKNHDLFIHVIHLKEGDEKKPAFEAKEIFSYMDIPAWIRRIAE
jgi:multicomponent Na+:H+ antiporter subunit E